MPLTLAVETFPFAFVFPHGGLAFVLGYPTIGLDNTCLALAFLISLLLSPTRRGNKCSLFPFALLDGLLGRHEHIQ